MRAQSLGLLIVLAACRLGDLIDAPQPSATLAVAPTQLAESATVGSTTPWTGKLTLAPTETGSVAWRAWNDSAWLHLSRKNGNTPDTITVSLDPAGLGEGDHRDVIVFTVAPPNPDTTHTTRVEVTFRITAEPPPPPPPPPPPVSASQSTVAASPTTITAGSGSSTITVTARDANGNPISGATVELSATGSGNTLNQPTGPTNASGVATGTLSSTEAGTKTVSARIDSVAVTQTAMVTVAEPPPPPTTKLAFTEHPPSGFVGQAFDVEVRAYDDADRLATGFTGEVRLTLSSNPLGASLTGNTRRNAVNGVARFTGLGVDRPCTGCRIQATADGLAGASSNAFTVVLP